MYIIQKVFTGFHVVFYVCFHVLFLFFRRLVLDSTIFALSQLAGLYNTLTGLRYPTFVFENFWTLFYDC